MAARHYYDLSLRTGRSHARFSEFHEFLSGHSWPSPDRSGDPVRIADSSLSLGDFRQWVSNETDAPIGDVMVEEITATSPNHDDRRDLIARYFKVTL